MLANGDYYLKEGFKNYNENVPFFMPFGNKDYLTSFSAGKQFFESLNCKDKTFREWDGLYHEIHNEPERGQVIQEYIDWILKHV